MADRASGGTETEIRVAVADDEEVFSSPSDFVRDVTLDALRHFSTISIVSQGPSMSVSIVLRWTGEGPDEGWKSMMWTAWWAWITWSGQDAEVTVSARGVDSAKEQEALNAVHNAIKRGGTDRFGQRRAFLVGIQLAAVGVFIAVFLAVTFLTTGNIVPDLGTSNAIDFSGDLANVALGLLALLSVAAVLGVTVGRWAYPSLEVAERGETRLWRVARWFGGIAVTISVAVVIKLLTNGQ